MRHYWLSLAVLIAWVGVFQGVASAQDPYAPQPAAPSAGADPYGGAPAPATSAPPASAPPAADPYAGSPAPAPSSPAPASSSGSSGFAGSAGPPPPAGQEPPPPPPQRSAVDPHEDKDKDYFFFGGVYRYSYVPVRLLKIIFEHAVPVKNHQFGGEFIYRRNGMDLIFDVYYARYYFDGAFVQRGNPDTDTQIINSRLWSVSLGITFLWSAVINDVLAFEFGMGMGAGYVGGELRRTEAYPDATAKRGYSACTGVGNPDPTYCDGPSVADGQQGGKYNVITRKWIGGGQLPNVWPRLVFPQIAIRIKPIRQIMLRIEGGFDFFSGAFAGGAFAFGF